MKPALHIFVKKKKKKECMGSNVSNTLMTVCCFTNACYIVFDYLLKQTSCDDREIVRKSAYIVYVNMFQC